MKRIFINTLFIKNQSVLFHFHTMYKKMIKLLFMLIFLLCNNFLIFFQSLFILFKHILIPISSMFSFYIFFFVRILYTYFLLVLAILQFNNSFAQYNSFFSVSLIIISFITHLLYDKNLYRSTFFI